MSAPELHLFVVWPKARFVADRILEDLRRETEVVWTGVMRFEGDMALAYRRFYGPSLPDARRKVANCGTGPFVVAVVRDVRPQYDTVDAGGRSLVHCNVRMLGLKTKYREWAGRKHRVHGTVVPEEFARDVEMLTGRKAAEWQDGAPRGELRPKLPDGWAAVSSLVPFARGRMEPTWGADADERPELVGRTLFLKDKYINDAFYSGTCLGLAAVEKRSSKAIRSIGNEYKVAALMHDAAPTLVPRPLAWRFAADGSWAAVVTERVEGPSLTELMRRGLADAEADTFAADILALAEALSKAGVVHRDLFADNLLLGADGHLKTIDWQLAVERASYREDPWVVRHWKFRYVVFGVNRELGLGVWNDFHALWKLLAEFPQTEFVKSVRANLSERMAGEGFSARPDKWTRMKLWMYGLSLRLQMALRGKRHRKHAQLERRWRTVTQNWR